MGIPASVALGAGGRCEGAIAAAGGGGGAVGCLAGAAAGGGGGIDLPDGPGRGARSFAKRGIVPSVRGGIAAAGVLGGTLLSTASAFARSITLSGMVASARGVGGGWARGPSPRSTASARTMSSDESSSV